MDELKKALLGEIKKPDEAEFKLILTDELKKPLNEDNTCYCVCKNCRNIFQINEEVAMGFLNIMGMLGSLPGIPANRISDSGLYFEVGYCNLCGRGSEVHIELKGIKNVKKK